MMLGGMSDQLFSNQKKKKKKKKKWKVIYTVNLNIFFFKTYEFK